MRSIGLALCNGFSRLGGFLAPYCTVFLVARGHTHAAAMGGETDGEASARVPQMACMRPRPFMSRKRQQWVLSMLAPSPAT